MCENASQHYRLICLTLLIKQLSLRSKCGFILVTVSPGSRHGVWGLIHTGLKSCQRPSGSHRLKEKKVYSLTGYEWLLEEVSRQSCETGYKEVYGATPKYFHLTRDSKLDPLLSLHKLSLRKSYVLRYYVTVNLCLRFHVLQTRWSPFHFTFLVI